MNDNNETSVIITTYKRPLLYVKRAVESVLRQTYQDFELIVVDDSPKDFPEREAIKGYLNEFNDPRIILIQHEENSGACAARNTGIMKSVGRFIAFLDDDDIWHIDKLEKQINKIKSANYGLVYCRQHVIDERKNTDYYPQKNYYEGMVFDKLILTNFVGSTSFVVVRKECFESVGMFDESMPASQDLEMWLRIAQGYEVGFVDEAMVDYYIHEGESITGNLDKKTKAIVKILDYYSDYFDSHPYEKSIRYIKASPYFAVGKNYTKALYYYLRGLTLYPLNLRFNIIYFGKLIRAALFRII